MDSVEDVDRASISCRHSDLLCLNCIVKDSHYHSHKTPKRQEPTFYQNKAQDERLTLEQDIWWIDSCWSWNREHQQHRSNTWLSGHLIPLQTMGMPRRNSLSFQLQIEKVWKCNGCILYVVSIIFLGLPAQHQRIHGRHPSQTSLYFVGFSSKWVFHRCSKNCSDCFCI